MKKRLTKYLAITFGITYLFWGGLAVLIQTKVLDFAHPAAVIMHLLGGFGPTIASLFLLDNKLTIKNLLRFIFHSAGGFWCFLLFCGLEIALIGLSSLELNPAMPLYSLPLVFLQAVILYGGNEELGWRGVMEPMLEEIMPFPCAALLIGAVWSVWHLPLWFCDGASQQNIPFLLFALLAVLLSFWMGAIYKRTKCVFYCCVFHGLTNTLLSAFVIKVNLTLIVGAIVLLGLSVWVWYRAKTNETKKPS